MAAKPRKIFSRPGRVFVWPAFAWVAAALWVDLCLEHIYPSTLRMVLLVIINNYLRDHHDLTIIIILILISGGS